MATRASRLALAGSNISATGEVDADLLDNTDSTAFLSLNGSGFLGIGMASPQRHVVLYAPTASGQTNLQFQNSTTGTALGDGFGVGMDAAEKGFIWNYESNDTYIGGTTGGTSITVAGSSGNVGIGDTSPSEKFTIKGDGARMTISSNDYEVAMLGRRGSTSPNWDRGYLRMKYDGANTIILDTGGVSYLNGGNVGIGTNNPGNPLHVTGGDVGGVVKVEQTVATNTPTMFIKQTGQGGNNNVNQGLLIEVDGNNSGDGNIIKAVGTNSNLNGGANVHAFVVKNSGKVGIGATSPVSNHKMTIKETASENASIVFTDTDDMIGAYVGMARGTNQIVTGATSIDLVLGTAYTADTHLIANNAIGLTLKNGGNVGIGTVSPDAIFTVDTNVGGSSTGTIARFHASKGANDSTFLQIAATRHGTASVQRVQLQAFDDDGSTGRTLALNPSGGNVGIGLNTPNAGLEIQGPYIGVNGVDDDYFKALKLSLPDQTEWGSQVQFSVGRWVNSGNHAMSSLVIALGNGTQNSDNDADTRVMTLTSNGRVVFSPTGAQDGQGVTTYANGANGHYISCTGTPNYWITNHGVASATGTLSTFYNNGTYCGGINISSTNVTSYVSASDYRLKENVAPMTGATERLKQLNPVTFDWINSGESSEGFIAHEVGAIVPISTTGTKDEVYDEEGAADNPKINEGDPKYQSVDPAKLVPLLVKTIQELEARLTAAGI